MSVSSFADEPRRRRPTVADTAKRKMVYMPPAAARRLRQLAFDDECKENDLFLEAMRQYFERRGIKDNNLWTMTPEQKRK